MVNEIYVINVYGYIGTSTKSENEYAKRTNKPFFHLVNRNTLFTKE